MNKCELCDILTKWLGTFDSTAKFSRLDDLTDGVVMAQVLHEISPEWFTSVWLSKIKTDTGANWRLKVSNLKKIQEKILDYYQEAFGQHLPQTIKPDVVKIGDGGDPNELARLLQLILGCAVNCDNKQEYIRRIMCMEENDQRMMMECIQELEASGGGALSFADSFGNSHMEVLITQLNAANVAKEKAELRVNELDLTVATLQEEKNALLSENRRLLDEVHSRFEPTGSGPLRRQVDALKEEVFKLETIRDDYRLKMEHQDREMIDLQARVDELTRSAIDTRALKDELDVLRETADKVEKYEATLQSYKKKLEEAGDVKREMKLLEAKVQHYIQANMDLEEEVKRTSQLKAQVEIYKKQVADLRDQLADETKRADKLEYELKMVQDKLNAALREKERLVEERDWLREANEEMKCAAAALHAEGNSDGSDGVPGSVAEGFASLSELKQKIARIEHENRMLRIAQKEQEEGSLTVVQNLLDDARSQADKLWQENREANQKIIQLEGELKELGGKDSHNLVPKSQVLDLQEMLAREKRKYMAEIEEKEAALVDANQENLSLREKLSVKDNELQESEEKFKRYVDKARTVAKAIEPGLDLSSTEASLRSQLLESQRSLKEKEKAVEDIKKVAENEVRLMTTAWHKLGQKKQRETVEERLASLRNGQFLDIHRQPVARRSHTFNSSH